MSRPLAIEALVSIHTLMQQMLEEAVSGNWQTLNELDAKRRELIQRQDSFDNTPTGTPNATDMDQNETNYTSWCEKILQLDTQITQTVQEAKQKLVEENRHMRNQVIAKNVYAQAANANSSFYNQK